MGSMIIKRLLLVLALVASLAFVVAGCGDANDSSSGDSAVPRPGTAARPRCPGTSPAPARAPRTPRCRRGSPGSSRPARTRRCPMTRSAPAAVVSSSSPGGVDFAGSDSALADDELKGAQDRCGGPDNLIEIPVYVSPIAVIYNIPGVDSLQLSPETRRRSSPRRSRTGTTRRSPRTTRTPSCPTCASRRSTAPTSPARRPTSPTGCPRRRPTCGPTRPTATGP